MIQRTVLIFLILIHMFTCNSQTTASNPSDYYLKNVNKSISPGQTKLVEIIEKIQNKIDTITQIAIGFGYPQIKNETVIFTAKGTDLDIDIVWLHDNDLLIKYPDKLKILKKDSTVQFINDFVDIYYQEKLLPDSLSAIILKYEHIGIMDTITAILKGSIIDLNSKVRIKNAYVSLASGLVLTSCSTNINGLYQFNHIHAGNYRFKIIAPGYNVFEMDTLHLGMGDIKELNIGLIKK